MTRWPAHRAAWDNDPLAKALEVFGVLMAIKDEVYVYTKYLHEEKLSQDLLRESGNYQRYLQINSETMTNGHQMTSYAEVRIGQFLNKVKRDIEQFLVKRGKLEQAGCFMSRTLRNHGIRYALTSCAGKTVCECIPYLCINYDK